MVSFVTVQPDFKGADIRVMWHEHSAQNSYVVDLGFDISVHLLPADARDLVAKLTAAMAARGDAVDWEAAAKQAGACLESLAHDARWERDGTAQRLRAVGAEARQWAILHPEAVS